MPTNARSLTGAVCSENVTKQKPEELFQSFTLPSSPPVTMSWPSGE